VLFLKRREGRKSSCFFGYPGGTGFPLSCFAALGLAAAIGFLVRLSVLCCAVVGTTPVLRFAAALGLAAVLCLALLRRACEIDSRS
jgi:hypothetical protein